jgi:hypothetical protein
VERIGLWLAWLAQLAHAGLEAVLVVSIGRTIRVFQGEGHLGGIDGYLRITRIQRNNRRKFPIRETASTIG